MGDSRIGGLYRLSVPERIDELQRRGWLSAADAEQLRQGRSTLLAANADKMAAISCCCNEWCGGDGAPDRRLYDIM
jgi:hypothetical protein